MVNGFVPKDVDFDKERLLFVMVQTYMDKMMEAFMLIFEDMKSEAYFEITVREALEKAAHAVISTDETINARIKKKVLDLIDSEGK